jgi:hypothetical protein
MIFTNIAARNLSKPFALLDRMAWLPSEFGSREIFK